MREKSILQSMQKTATAEVERARGFTNSKFNVTRNKENIKAITMRVTGTH